MTFGLISGPSGYIVYIYIKIYMYTYNYDIIYSYTYINICMYIYSIGITISKCHTSMLAMVYINSRKINQIFHLLGHPSPNNMYII